MPAGTPSSSSRQPANAEQRGNSSAPVSAANELPPLEWKHAPQPVADRRAWRRFWLMLAIFAAWISILGWLAWHSQNLLTT